MKTIAVVGAGTMGGGIAQLAASSGCSVRLIDTSAAALHEGIARLKTRLQRSAEKGRITRAERHAILNRIMPSQHIEELDGVELAIEAVTEDPAVKREVFASLERNAPLEAILATNTSSLSVKSIAEGLEDPGRVVGMHFFNPAPVMALVEVIAAESSDPASVDAVFDTARAWGKTPVIAKDTPGFIVNRVARGFYLEALRLLGEGVAGVDEIDLVMRRHGGFRMGPFELMDLVGLDVNLATGTSVWKRMDEHPRFVPHQIQEELVRAGHLGRKSGRGFYLYDDDQAPLLAHVVDRQSFQVSPLLRDAILSFATRAGAASANSTEHYIFARILGAIINEAGSAYDDEVASAGDIDVAMVNGANYPKGPLAWSDDIGHRTVRGVLRALNSGVDDGRFAPAKLFVDAK